MNKNPGEIDKQPEGVKVTNERRAYFNSLDEKYAHDALELLKMAREKCGMERVTVRDALDLATRDDDDLDRLRRALALIIKNSQIFDEVFGVEEDSVESEYLLSSEQKEKLFSTLEARFNTNMSYHENIVWEDVERRLKKAHPEKLWKLNEMESTGGEPDVVGFVKATGEYEFWDLSKESPEGRRNLLYDKKCEESAEIAELYKSKIKGNAVDMAAKMGLGGILDFDQYIYLQTLGAFDTTTWSYVKTPEHIREKGVAYVGAYRDGHKYTFVDERPALSTDTRKGFRGWLRV